jgi:hypothetical protein
MAQRTVIEEDVTKLSQYRPIKALAEKKVSDDGTVEVTAHLSMLGITFTLEEIAVLMRELPRVVERAGALAAKLKTEHFEPPMVTPIGNLIDKLEEVRSAPPESAKLELSTIVVIVNGQDVVVTADKLASMTLVKIEALKSSGNTGRVFESWEFRSEAGFLIPDEKLVRDLGWKPRVFLTLRAGIGGSDASIAAPVTLDQPGKDV